MYKSFFTLLTLTLLLSFFAPVLSANPDGNIPSSTETKAVNTVIQKKQAITLPDEKDTSDAQTPPGKSEEPDTPEGLTKKMIFKDKLLLEHAIDKMIVFFSWKGFEAWRLIYFGIGLLFSVILSLLTKKLIGQQYLFRLFIRKEYQGISILCSALARPLTFLIFLGGLFLSMLPILMELSPQAFRISERIYFAGMAILATYGLYNLVQLLENFLINLMPNHNNEEKSLIAGIVCRVVKTVLLLVALLFISENILKLNITALLAGAGVAGVAVAFAAQETIANFFGSVVIIFERPFKVGDFVKIDGREGIVEKVGLRSTVLRTLDGHVISVPNKITANTSIENVTLRPSIKKIVNLGLVYDTPPEKMELAVTLLKELFNDHEGMNPAFPPRIHFTAFNDFSLNIQIIAWYHPGDFMMALDWWNKMNFEILKRFNEAGLEFAFPTNTTYLAYDPKRSFPSERKCLPDESR